MQVVAVSIDRWIDVPPLLVRPPRRPVVPFLGKNERKTILLLFHIFFIFSYFPTIKKEDDDDTRRSSIIRVLTLV